MKWRSLVGVAAAVDPAVFAPSRVVAWEVDVGAVGSRALNFCMIDCRSVVGRCGGIAVGPPVFITSMPSITFMVCWFPQRLAGERAQPLLVGAMMMAWYGVGLT